jgi:hypothetical protein
MRKLILTILLSTLVLLCGCGGTGKTKFVHPDFDFSFMEKVGVVPFENLSDDQGAGARATRFFTGALLASEAFWVVEPGEMTYALGKQSLLRTAEVTEAQAVAIGKDLGVQGLFLGTVNESAMVRSGSSSVAVVTVVVRLVETETGSTVWSVTHSEDSRTFWSSLFGGGQKSISEVTRSCIDSCLDTLLD